MSTFSDWKNSLPYVHRRYGENNIWDDGADSGWCAALEELKKKLKTTDIYSVLKWIESELGE